jgi:hypothetical protein
MSELDPHLATLLRRAPPAPVELDQAHRQAILVAARQAWFRQRARSRRNLVGLATAAVFAAAIAGWTVRSLVHTPVQTASPVVAVAERMAEPSYKSEEAAALPTEPVAASPPPAPAMGANDLDRAPKPAGNRARRRAEPAASAMSLDAALPSPRGRLVMASLVLDAIAAGRLAEADRLPALQAALDSLAGLDDPEAEALRVRLGAALAQP